MIGIRFYTSTLKRNWLTVKLSVNKWKSSISAIFLTFTEKALPQLSGPEQGEWLEQLEQDHDNFRAALTYALNRDTSEEVLNLASNLCRFWSIRGHYTEGRGWLERALAQSASSPTRARSYALRNASWMAMQQGDYEVANATQLRV